MIYLSPNHCHQSLQPATKNTSWCLFGSQFFFPSFTNITQLGLVHDENDAVIVGPQTQLEFLQAIHKSIKSLVNWSHAVHLRTHTHTTDCGVWTHNRSFNLSQFCAVFCFTASGPLLDFLSLTFGRSSLNGFDKSGHFRDHLVCLWFVLVGLCL